MRLGGKVNNEQPYQSHQALTPAEGKLLQRTMIPDKGKVPFAPRPSVVVENIHTYIHVHTYIHTRATVLSESPVPGVL